MNVTKPKLTLVRAYYAPGRGALAEFEDWPTAYVVRVRDLVDDSFKAELHRSEVISRGAIEGLSLLNKFDLAVRGEDFDNLRIALEELLGEERERIRAVVEQTRLTDEVTERIRRIATCLPVVEVRYWGRRPEIEAADMGVEWGDTQDYESLRAQRLYLLLGGYGDLNLDRDDWALGHLPDGRLVLSTRLFQGARYALEVVPAAEDAAADSRS